MEPFYLKKFHHLTIQDFPTTEVYVQCERMVQDIELARASGEAQEVLSWFRSILANDADPAVQQKYHSLVVRLQWVAFSLLPQHEAEELLHTSLVSALRHDIDLRGKIESYLVLYNDDVTGQSLRRSFTQALRENTETLGDATLGNWLLQYERFFPLTGGRVRGPVEQAAYMAKYSAANALRQKEKNSLGHILRAYDALRFYLAQPWLKHDYRISPRIPQRPQASLGSVVPVVPSPVSVPKSSGVLVMPHAVLAAYTADEAMNKAVSSKAEQLERTLQGNKTQGLKITLDTFHAILQQPQANSIELMGLLVMLAKNGWLLAFLTEDKEFQNACIALVQNTSPHLDSAAMGHSLVNPRFVAALLKCLLKKYAGLSDSASARMGVYLGNVCKQGGAGDFYTKMAYFDVKVKEFKWY